MTDDRKAKLKALAARAGRAKEPRNDDDNGNDEDEGNEAVAVIVAAPKKVVVFRNYAPNDKSIQQQQDQQSNNNDKELELSSPSSKRQKKTASTSSSTTTTTQAGESSPVAVVVSSSQALQDALQETRREVNAADNTTASADNTVPGKTPNTKVAAISTVTSMAPKKINWDLKRDISDKLAKLERRTQKAVVSMLKERLESEAAKAVNEDGDDSDLD